MTPQARKQARARAEALDKVKKQLREGHITKAQMKQKAKVGVKSKAPVRAKA